MPRVRAWPAVLLVYAASGRAAAEQLPVQLPIAGLPPAPSPPSAPAPPPSAPAPPPSAPSPPLSTPPPVALVPPPASGEESSRRSPFHLQLIVDVPVLVVGLTLWAVPFALLTDELQGAFCGHGTLPPCDRNNVNAFDRTSIPVHIEGARTAADVMLYALPPIFFTIRMIDYGASHWRGYLTDAFVVAETVVWSGVVNEFTRRLVRRPRPFMYEEGVFPDKRDSVEATLSYYSGHTSAAFAFSVATAFAYTLRHPHSKWRYPMWIGLLAYATSQGVLRVISGDHFPTDVIAGALIGSGIGLLVPALHLKRDVLDRHPRLSLSLVPGQLPGGAMVSLLATF